MTTLGLADGTCVATRSSRRTADDESRTSVVDQSSNTLVRKKVATLLRF